MCHFLFFFLLLALMRQIYGRGNARRHVVPTGAKEPSSRQCDFLLGRLKGAHSCFHSHACERVALCNDEVVGRYSRTRLGIPPVSKKRLEHNWEGWGSQGIFFSTMFWLIVKRRYTWPRFIGCEYNKQQDKDFTLYLGNINSINISIVKSFFFIHSNTKLK